MVESVSQQLDQNKTGHHRGPLVLSSRHEQMVDPKIFELLQNASDAFNTKTEFDKFVDQKTGEINLSSLASSLSVCLWGLILAKSRATFTMADLVKRDELMAKKKQVLTLTLMMAVAQLLKMLSENSFG